MLLVARFLQTQGRQALQTVEESASPGVTEPNFVTAALVDDDAPGDGILENSASVESPLSPLPTHDAEAVPLPYDGDMQAAMKAQDRAAIRILMAARVENKPHNPPTQVDATAAPAQTRRVRPQPPPPLPRANVGIMAKGRRVMGSMTILFTQHRAAAVVLSIWVSLFLQLWNPQQQLTSHETRITMDNPFIALSSAIPQLAAGSQFITSDSMDSLDRASVLAHAKSIPSPVSGNPKRKVTLRRDMAEKKEEEFIDEDAADVLKRFLLDQATPGRSKSQVLAEDVLLAWQALIKLYTARGMHAEATEAGKSAATYRSANSAHTVDGIDAEGEELVAAIAAEDAGFDEDYLSLAQQSAVYIKGSVADSLTQPLEQFDPDADPEANVREWIDAFGLRPTPA